MKLRLMVPVAMAAAILFVPTVRAADALSPACLAHATVSLDALVRGDYAGARKDFGDAIAGKAGAVADYQVPAHVDARVIGDIAAWVEAQPPR